MNHALFQLAAIINQSKSGIPSGDDFKIIDLLHAVYLWSGIIAVIVIIISGFFYVTAANNASQVTRAKNALLSAVIGLIIVILAFSITDIVMGAV